MAWVWSCEPVLAKIRLTYVLTVASGPDRRSRGQGPVGRPPGRCSSVGQMRFGLVGTGYWARVTHAPALACTEGAELTAVWGRDPRAAADLAAEYQATAYHDVSAFLAGIDAVSFAVPPDVQAPIATQAAREGKHLLLEKPVALPEAGAGGRVAAVWGAGGDPVGVGPHR